MTDKDRFAQLHLLRRRPPRRLPGVPGCRAVSRAPRLGRRAGGVRVSRSHAASRQAWPHPGGGPYDGAGVRPARRSRVAGRHGARQRGGRPRGPARASTLHRMPPPGRERLALAAGARAVSGPGQIMASVEERGAANRSARWRQAPARSSAASRSCSSICSSRCSRSSSVLRDGEEHRRVDPRAAAVRRGPARPGPAGSGRPDLRQCDRRPGRGGGPGAAGRTRVLGAGAARGGRVGHGHGVLRADPGGRRMGRSGFRSPSGCSPPAR